jgi:CheY-like chemotaxis protein
MPRVLLVDDDPSVRGFLYSVLEGAGYEVLAANNGPDGLNIFQQAMPSIDLLVTDYNMPDMSGLELARECSRYCDELCVLYVSGARPDQELAEDLETPGHSFLGKPFRKAELLQRVRELMLAARTGVLTSADREA